MCLKRHCIKEEVKELEKLITLIVWNVIALAILAPFYINADSEDRGKYGVLYVLVFLLSIKRSIE